MKICLDCNRFLSGKKNKCIYCNSKNLKSYKKISKLSKDVVNLEVTSNKGIRYKIISSIASGAYGQIFSVKEISTNKVFAMKTPLSFWNVYSNIQYNQKRLKQENEIIIEEIEKLKKYKHKNIISLYDTGMIDKKGEIFHFFIMDLLEDNVESLFGTLGNITPIEKIKIIKEVAEGLAYLNMNGLVYRDLSLKNIGIYDDGDKIRYVIFDFGTARFIKEETWSLQGTARYICPCYFQESAKYARDPRIDVYSLGVVATEIMLGITDWFETYMDPNIVLPFSINFSEVILNEEDIFKNNAGIDYRILEKIINILKKATQKDITKRYESCIEFKEKFNEVIKELTIDPNQDIPRSIKILFEINIQFPFNFSKVTFILPKDEYQEGKITRLPDPRGIEISIPFSKPIISRTTLPSFYDIVLSRYNSFQIRLNETKFKEMIKKILEIDPNSKGDLLFKSEIVLEENEQ